MCCSRVLFSAAFFNVSIAVTADGTIQYLCPLVDQQIQVSFQQVCSDTAYTCLQRRHIVITSDVGNCGQPWCQRSSL